MLKTLVLAALLTGAAACGHAPVCDYGQAVGTCSPSITSRGSDLLVQSERCSEVDFTINGKRGSVRAEADEPVYVGRTTDEIELLGCRTYRDNSGKASAE